MRASDVGRLFQDLSISYRPTDLCSAIEQAYETHERVTISRTSWSKSAEDERFACASRSQAVNCRGRGFRCTVRASGYGGR